MFAVIGINAVCRKDHLPISLISVDRRHADTGMSVDSRQYEPIRVETGEDAVESGAIKRTVSFLNNDRIGRSDRQVRNNLGSFCSLYCDAYSLRPHFRECVSQVRLELLTNPHYGPAAASQDADERVGGLNKPLPRGRCPCSKKVIQHVDYDQRGRVHGARLQDPLLTPQRSIGWGQARQLVCMPAGRQPRHPSLRGNDGREIQPPDLLTYLRKIEKNTARSRERA